MHPTSPSSSGFVSCPFPNLDDQILAADHKLADGGGYSDFGAVYDPSVLMNTNDNGFITVEIQYRLGAFGYLASSDVKEHGELNVGLLDQRFALEWVREHIAKFGGDPTRVTVGGESSGAGSVMYLSMAYGGEESHLFNNVSNLPDQHHPSLCKEEVSN